MPSMNAKTCTRLPSSKPIWMQAWITALGILSVLSSLAVAGEPQQKNTEKSSTQSSENMHPLVPVLRLAKSSQKTLQDIKDFDATFSKKELVNGRVYPHTMFIKNRRKPFSVYLRFFKPHEGREVIYYEGKNGGNLLAHETGIKAVVGTVSLVPTSKQALSEGRYPITRIGVHNMLETVIKQWENETKYGEVNVTYYPNAKLNNSNRNLREMLCKVIETSHPHPRKQFPYHLTRLYIEKKTNLPVRVEQYGFPQREGAPPVLIAEYTYWNIRSNIGLKNIDFDPENPQYGF